MLATVMAGNMDLPDPLIAQGAPSVGVKSYSKDHTKAVSGRPAPERETTAEVFGLVAHHRNGLGVACGAVRLCTALGLASTLKEPATAWRRQ